MIAAEVHGHTLTAARGVCDHCGSFTSDALALNDTDPGCDCMCHLAAPIIRARLNPAKTSRKSAAPKPRKSRKTGDPRKATR